MSIFVPSHRQKMCVCRKVTTTPYCVASMRFKEFQLLCQSLDKHECKHQLLLVLLFQVASTPLSWGFEMNRGSTPLKRIS